MFTIIIPAKFNDDTMPGKLLEKISGKTVIQHICENCTRTNANRIIVITDQCDVKWSVKELKEHNIDVVINSYDDSSGLTRVGNYLSVYFQQVDRLSTFVCVQPDEFFVDPEHINAVAQSRTNNYGRFVTAATELVSDELNDPKVRKVVVNAEGLAMFYSNLPIGNCSHKKRPDYPLKALSLCAFKINDIIDLYDTISHRYPANVDNPILYHRFSNYVNKVNSSVAKCLDSEDDLRYICNVFKQKELLK